MTSNQKSLQDLINSVPNLVEHFSNDVSSPHFARSGSRATSFIPPAYTNWRDEQRSWANGVALLHLSHHMPELFLEGPDALHLIERLCINSVANWSPNRAKQIIVTAPSGHVIGDCITYRHGEQSFELVSGMPLQNWVAYQAEISGLNVSVTRDAPSNLNTSGRRTKYRFQLEGPNAAAVFARVIDGAVPDLKFFHTANISIRGHQALVLRHGMAGHMGVEISGPFEDEQVIRQALMEAGEGLGLVPVGTTAYFTTSLSNGWMAYPVPAIFTDETLRPYREWLPADSWEAHTELGGSFQSDAMEDYYATPYDLGYGHVVKFDHDFIGRKALEELPDEKKRQKVCLVWNRDDVVKVFGSQFGSGVRYKSIDMPASYYSWNHFDEVRANDGTFAGVSCHSGYLASEGEFLSLAMLNPRFAKPGTELSITWGEPNGGSRKPQVESHEQTTIRATVSPVPFTAAVRDHFRDGVVASA